MAEQCTEDSMDTIDATPVTDETDARPSAGGEGQGAARGPQISGSQAKDSFCYRMDFPRRGRAVIINNKTFLPKTGMSVRNGTDTDAAALYQRFKAMDFDTVLKNNLTTIEMHRLLKEEAKRDHTDESCFLCCILSHGEEGKIYGTDGIIPIDTMTQYYKGDRCLTLAGKPKIFVIQACRGTKLDHGVEMTDAEPDTMDTESVYRIPSEADFLMAYSVVPGYFSWRNSTKGSWFVQALCSVLHDYGETEEIMTMMTRVNQKVSYDFESNAAREFMNQKKQVPSIVTMLTKQLYFTPRK